MDEDMRCVGVKVIGIVFALLVALAMLTSLVYVDNSVWDGWIDIIGLIVLLLLAPLALPFLFVIFGSYEFILWIMGCED